MKHKNIVYVTATICILIGFTMKLLNIPHANILIYLNIMMVCIWQGVYISKLEKKLNNN